MSLQLSEKGVSQNKIGQNWLDFLYWIILAIHYIFKLSYIKRGRFIQLEAQTPPPLELNGPWNVGMSEKKVPKKVLCSLRAELFFAASLINYKGKK